MPKWLKFVLLLLGIGIVGFGLLVGGIAWWVSSNKDRIVEGSRTAQDEGQRFGATHTKDECIGESLTHVKACGMMDFVCEATEKLRLMACMPVAEDDLTCKDVPQRTEIFKIASWSAEQCERRGLRGSQPCGRLMQGVVEACAQRPVRR